MKSGSGFTWIGNKMLRGPHSSGFRLEQCVTVVTVDPKANPKIVDAVAKANVVARGVFRSWK